MSTSHLPEYIGLDNSAVEDYSPEIEVPEIHRLAYNDTESTDSQTFLRNSNACYVSRGADSCYFTFGTQGDVVHFEHLIVGTEGNENRFARRYFRRLFPEGEKPNDTKIVMYGVQTTHGEGLRSDDRAYQSSLAVNDILKVHTELENILSDGKPVEKHKTGVVWSALGWIGVTRRVLDKMRLKRKFPQELRDRIPENVALNVVHIPTKQNWDTIAVTFGDGKVVIWDELTDKPIAIFDL